MIYIDNEQDKVNLGTDFEETLKSVIEFTLKEEEVTLNTQISVVLTDNEEIRKLNKEFRGIDRATDVLSFPMLDYPPHKVYKEAYRDEKFDISYFEGDELILGDVVLSLEKALEQSVEYNHSFQREVAYLTVHSILHLLGYDHMEEEDKELMRAREEYILNKLNIKRE